MNTLTYNLKWARHFQLLSLLALVSGMAVAIWVWSLFTPLILGWIPASVIGVLSWSIASQLRRNAYVYQLRYRAELNRLEL